MKLGHALANNGSLIEVNVPIHANRTSAAVASSIESPAAGGPTTGGVSRRSQKRWGRATTEKQHVGIERKYGAGGK